MNLKWLAVDLQLIWPLLVDFGEGANPKRRKKLILVKHIFQHALQPLALRNRQQHSLLAATIPESVAWRDVSRQLFFVFQKPIHALGETRQLVGQILVKNRTGEQRDDADDRAHPQW